LLAELRICDLAIIDELELTFGPVFSVLTGETGAGKSIIIDAVELVLGGRADSSIVRAGSDRALVEATFRLEPDQQRTVGPVLKRQGLDTDDPRYLMLAREVRLGGRNVCRVNGRSVTLSLLRRLAGGLVDIHGQSEHLSLLRLRDQLDLLDRYARVMELRSRVGASVSKVRGIRAELDSLLNHERELAQRADLLKFQAGEIRGAALRIGEDVELLAERVRLSNAEQLSHLVGEALVVLEDSGSAAPCVVDLVGIAFRAVDGLVRIDSSLGGQLQAVEAVTYQIEALIQGLRKYREEIEFNPQRLEAVEARLNLIRLMERKYGQTIGDVLQYASDAEDELDRVIHSEERIDELQQEESRALPELGELALELSRERRVAAQRLAADIEAEMRDLRLEGVRFAVRFRRRPDESGVLVPDEDTDMEWCVSRHGAESTVSGRSERRVSFDASGIDLVEFLVSTNPGEPLMPIAKVASGGETSRLMLALKTVLSRADQTPTLIFDEIDQGIGGRIGATVGLKLWQLAAWGFSERAQDGGAIHQVLCVTHLPQLAGFGDEHLCVSKDVINGRTVTQVRYLDGESRVQELAQMLGGTSDAAVQSAEEILAQVAEQKAHFARNEPDGVHSI